MLATRIIPTLLNRRGALVKGKGFAADRVVGIVRQAARIHQARNVDEMILLDVAADPGRPDVQLVRDIASEMFMPLTVGGGIRTLDNIRDLLWNGADKVSLCTAALETPELISDAARKFGRQAVVVSVDVDQGFVSVRCGRRLCQVKPVEHARRCVALGAGEILLTSVPRDGMMCGYDLELIRDVCAAVDVPVIASGGCGTYADMVAALDAGAHAVAAGSMFLFTDQTPRGAAQYLREHGYTARIAA